MEHHIEIETLEQFLERAPRLARCAVKRLDLSGVRLDWRELQVRHSVFLGCAFPSEQAEFALIRRGAHLFPRFEDLPYDPYRSSLYTWQELLESQAGGADASLDSRIYEHFQRAKRRPDIVEALAQRIHDHAIDVALEEFLAGDKAVPRKVVGIMGGHGLPRTDPFYRGVAEIARRLAARGYLIASGGGPGVMEAANLGAYLADHGADTLSAAIDHLGQVPAYRQPGFLELALALMERFPSGRDSLAVPTWFYGHEPVNPFATHIAKYFSNSIREDGLLAIALHGVIYAPGRFGTYQEIFLDLAQNCYGSFDYYSPMVFYGSGCYEESAPIFALVDQLAAGHPVSDMVSLSDDLDEVVDFICSHPPLAVGASSPGS